MLTFVRPATNEMLIYQNTNYPASASDIGGFPDVAPSPNTLIFGKYLNLDGVARLDGDIGVVRIYSNALSYANIVQLYTNGVTGLVR